MRNVETNFHWVLSEFGKIQDKVLKCSAWVRLWIKVQIIPYHNHSSRVKTMFGKIVGFQKIWGAKKNSSKKWLGLKN